MANSVLRMGKKFYVYWQNQGGKKLIDKSFDFVFWPHF